MNRWASIVLLFLLICFPLARVFAQDAAGEYAKALDAYKVYDYQTSCRRLGNFYEASRGFHEIPAAVVESIRESGKSETSLNQTAMQAENSREPAKACSDHFLRALFLSMEDQPLTFAKEVRSAQMQRELMIEVANPGARSKPEADYVIPTDTSSMAAIVAASKAATSGENGTCATEELMQRDSRLVRPCVHHLLMEARKQKSARQWTAAKINFKRAQQVNKMLGKKQDPAVANEVARAVRAIEVAQASQR